MKNVKIPLWLQEFHGEEVPLPTLIITYVVGIIVSLYAYFTGDFSDNWQIWLVCGLALDIGAGVIANLSSSTTLYYIARPKFRWTFITLHVVHPLLLWIVYPDKLWILLIGLITLMCTAVVNSLKEANFQRIIAGSLVIINLILACTFLNDMLLSILLICYSLKLILAFAVRWKVSASTIS